MVAIAISEVGQSAISIAVASGMVLGFPAAVRFCLRNGKNGNGKANGKTGFNPTACTDREARIRVLESQRDTPTGFNPATCQKHGEDIAGMTVGVQGLRDSMDRRFDQIGKSIDSLGKDVKGLAQEVARIPKQP